MHEETSSAVDTLLGRLKPRRKRERSLIVRWKRKDSVKQSSTTQQLVPASICPPSTQGVEKGGRGCTEEEVLHDNRLARQDPEGASIEGVCGDLLLNARPREVDIEE